MKRRAFLATALGMAALLGPQVLAAQAVKPAEQCLNTANGKFSIKGTSFSCTVHFVVTGGDKLKASTAGLVEGVDTTVNFQMDLNLKVLKKLFFDKKLVLPNQAVTMKLITKAGSVMPMTATLAPVIHLSGDPFKGQLRAVQAEPNITNLSSKLLPKFVTKSFMKKLNNDPELRARLIGVSNGALMEAQHAVGLGD